MIQYDEMAANVLRRVEAFEIKKRKMKRSLSVGLPAVCCLLLLGCFLGSLLKNAGLNETPVPSVSLLMQDPPSDQYHFLSYEERDQWLLENRYAPASFPIPFYKGSPIPVNTDDLSDISFYGRDLFALPWFYYSSQIENQRCSIRIACAKIDTAPSSMAEWVKQNYPDAPNVHNSDLFVNYSSITEQAIVVGNQRVSSLWMRTNNRTRTYLLFILDGNLVCIQAGDDLLTADFLAALSLHIA